MSDYLVCKIGQKVYFDRTSKECIRSNTNGGVGLYKLLSLLFENNQEDKFTMLSSYDTLEGFKNVDGAFEYTKLYDALIIIAGLLEYEKDIDMLRKLRVVKAKKVVVISEDPRCLASLYSKNNMPLPDVLLSQDSTLYCLNTRNGSQVTESIYVPIERACCYKENIYQSLDKDNKLVVVSNSTLSDYDRVGIVAQLVKGIDCDMYGRISERDLNKIEGINHKGEVNYSEITEALRKAKYTLLVPIEKDWLTSKYVEALSNNCMPIFYKDYAVKFLKDEVAEKYVVSSNEELKALLDYMNNHQEEVMSDMLHLKSKFVKDYIDGKKLSKEIMSKIKRRNSYDSKYVC